MGDGGVSRAFEGRLDEFLSMVILDGRKVNKARAWVVLWNTKPYSLMGMGIEDGRPESSRQSRLVSSRLVHAGGLLGWIGPPVLHKALAWLVTPHLTQLRTDLR